MKRGSGPSGRFITMLVTFFFSIAVLCGYFFLSSPRTKENTVPFEGTVVKIRMLGDDQALISIEESDVELSTPYLRDPGKLEEIRSLQHGQTISYRVGKDLAESLEEQTAIDIASLETNGHIIYTLDDYNALTQATFGNLKRLLLGFSGVLLLVSIGCFLSLLRDARKKKAS